MAVIESLLVPFVLLVAGASAQISTSPVLTITDCIDSSGFATCQQNANNNINCAAAYCWNRVNECNYQNYAISYLWNCPIARMPIPYFPFQDGAPDSCSCNVGKVFLSMIAMNQADTTCSNNARGGDAVAAVGYIQGCTCCRLTGDISSIWGLCPNTNPMLIGYDRVKNIQTTFNTAWGNCGSSLSKYPCGNLGFPSLNNNLPYLTPGSITKDGADPLSNTGGTVTAPALGPIFTYTNQADRQVYTISASGLGSKSGSSSGGGSSNNEGSSNSGSSSDSGSSQGKKNSAVTGGPDIAPLASLVVFLAYLTI